MSLEQQLAESTAAINALTQALNTFALVANKAFSAAQAPASDPAAATDAAITKARKPKKVETTRYFFREANDVVYRIEPTDAVQTPMEGSVEITADEFAAHQTRLAAKHGHLSAEKPAAEKPAAEVSNEVLMGAVTTLSQRSDGREHMTRILAEFGVPKFSLLPAQRRAEALALVQAAIAA